MDATLLANTTPNIVGCYMLRPFAQLVACCCPKFETDKTFSPVETNPTLLTNNSQHCLELLGLFARSITNGLFSDDIVVSLMIVSVIRSY